MKIASRQNDFRSSKPVRSDRLFQQGLLWYFKTREGSVEGPFIDRSMAADQLRVYVRNMQCRFATSQGLNLAAAAHSAAVWAQLNEH